MSNHLCHSDIPTSGLFGKNNGYSWNPVRGCNNFSCFLHPKNKGKCWAAQQCKWHAKPWAKSETCFLTTNVESDKSRIEYQENLKKNLQNFHLQWFSSQFYKEFPRRQSCILVGYQTDLAFAPKWWIERILKKILDNNQEREAAGLPLHVFQFLTKAPGKLYPCHPWPENCWLGETVQNQDDCKNRISINCRPMNLEYVYIEPMLEKIDLSPWLGISSYDGIDWVRDTGTHVNWVIVGGGDQPLNPDWVRSIRDQCQAAGIKFFLKSWGKWLPYGQESSILKEKSEPKFGYQDNGRAYKIGKKNSGNLLDGQKWEQFPEVKS